MAAQNTNHRSIISTYMSQNIDTQKTLNILLKKSSENSNIFIICIVISTSDRHNHVDEESDGEVDDWREEEEAKSNPDLSKCGSVHIVKDQTRKKVKSGKYSKVIRRY